MKHLSTYLPPFFYAALATVFVVLYASNGVINGDFLYGFERFSLLSDEPSPPELPSTSEMVLLASSMFIGSFFACKFPNRKLGGFKSYDVEEIQTLLSWEISS